MNEHQSELQQLEAQARVVNNRIRELRNINNLKDEDVPIIIEFDGGTSCNIPRQGFGYGYGSYQIQGQQIVRVKFGLGHSCNSAEIRTATAALLDLVSQYDYPSTISVLLRGDSKIALKWANPKYTSQPKQESTNNFIIAIKDIRQVAIKFKSIRTQWRSRDVSVKIFGH